MRSGTSGAETKREKKGDGILITFPSGLSCLEE